MNKRTRILKEAAKLFAVKGFNETAASEIAQAADTAQGTVFYHFGTKQGILQQLYENMVGEYMDGLEQAADLGATGLEAVRNILIFHYRFAEENSAEFTVLHRDVPTLLNSGENRCEIIKRNSDRSIGIMADVIKRGQTDGSIRKDLDALAMAKIFKGMLVGMTRMSRMHKIDYSDTMETCMIFCENALMNRG